MKSRRNNQGSHQRTGDGGVREAKGREMDNVSRVVERIRKWRNKNWSE